MTRAKTRIFISNYITEVRAIIFLKFLKMI